MYIDWKVTSKLTVTLGLHYELELPITELFNRSVRNWDLSVIKNVQINERMRFQFRTEFVNAWNRTQFSPPNTTPSSMAFGTVTSESHFARTIQFAAKLPF